MPMSHTAVISFGRINPPTIGHEKLVNKINDIAEVLDADPAVYLSHTQDSKRNPLPYLSKFFIASSAFGYPVKMSPANTIVKVMQDLESHYDNIVYVCGSDRVEEFEKLLHTYNGKDYNFKSIMVVSAGERDPDSDDVDGMSATKMRQAAKDGAIETFTSGLPDALKPMSSIIMNEVRTGLNV